MCAQVLAGASTTARPFKPSTGLALDWIERLTVLTLFGWLVTRSIAAYYTGGHLANLLLMPSEGLVVLFMVIRRRTNDVSRHPGEWMLAFSATCIPLLAIPVVGRSLVHLGAAVMLMLIGIVIQLAAKLKLGRSFGLVPANRGLKLSGPYRFVRHPMYAGYLLTHLGFLAINPTVWNFTVYAACYSLQIPRLLAEERLLSGDPSYLNYRTTVRYRLLPGLF